MIVSYLILAHANPNQLARLVQALPETSPVFVHIDARATDETYLSMRNLLDARPMTHFVKRNACRWGGIGIVKATQSLINEAVRSGWKFDYATLLSGSDYPIKTNSEIEGFLNDNQDKEFLESFSLIEPNRWSLMGGNYRTPDKVERLHLRFRSRVIRLPWRRKLPYGMKPFGGSQWWTLSHAAVVHISDYLSSHPKLMKFMKGVFIPDESLIQIVIAASPFQSKIYSSQDIDSSMRLVIWDRPQPPYPATLMSPDIELLSKSPALFARKFDDRVDAQILDLVDLQLRRGNTASAC